MYYQRIAFFGRLDQRWIRYERQRQLQALSLDQTAPFIHLVLLQESSHLHLSLRPNSLQLLQTQVCYVTVLLHLISKSLAV